MNTNKGWYSGIDHGTKTQSRLSCNWVKCMHLIMNGPAQGATRGRTWHSSALTHMHLIMNSPAQGATRGRTWHSSALTHMHLIMNDLAEPCPMKKAAQLQR